MAKCYSCFQCDSKFICHFWFKENLHLSPKQQVEVKNGLAYEVIINEAKCRTPTRLTPQSTPNRNLTNDEIRSKLLRAEERRQVSVIECIQASQVFEGRLSWSCRF